MPDAFALLSRSAEALTEPSSLRYGGPDYAEEERKQRIDALIAAGGEHADVVEAMVRRLFPAGSRHLRGGTHYGPEFQTTWLRERRVASAEILSLYLNRVAGEGLTAHTRAEALFAVIDNEQAFADALAAIDIDEREAAISALTGFERDFEVAHVVPGARVLLNALGQLPERDRGMFSFGPDITIARVVVRLLRTIDDEAGRERAIEEILAGVSSLSAQLELIEWVGHRDKVGNGSIAADTAQRLEAQWREQVRAATGEALANEREVLRLLAVARRDQDPGEPELEVPDDVRLTHALLRGALTHTRSQALDSRAVRKVPRLHWDTLVALFGDEDILTRRVEQLRASNETVDADLLELYDKYTGGWRPDELH